MTSKSTTKSPVLLHSREAVQVCALESVYREGWQSWAGSSVDRGNRGCVWSLGRTEEVKMAAWGALCLTYSETVATAFHNQNELPCFLAHFNRVLLFKRSLDLFYSTYGCNCTLSGLHFDFILFGTTARACPERVQLWQDAGAVNKKDEKWFIINMWE